MDKRWKHPQIIAKSGWIEHRWSGPAVEYYSALKRNPRYRTKDTILSEIQHYWHPAPIPAFTDFSLEPH